MDQVELGSYKNSVVIESLEERDGDRTGRGARSNDDADMQRLGKTPVFKRNFQFSSILAFSVVTLSGWCYVPSTLTYGLYNGGTGGVFSMFMFEFTGLFLVVLCLAEMASIAPTAGGQYHWASEFAPRNLQKILSYYSGWLGSLAWLSGVAGGLYITGFTLQGLILLANPSYVPKPWQCYLFAVMLTSVALTVNSVLARFLPKLEALIFVFFVITFMTFIVVLWVLPPHLTANEVFSTFQKGDGWNSLALSMLVGQANLLFTIIGSDSTAHMSEETKRASSVIPKAMITSFTLNGLTTLVMLITYEFCLVNYTDAENSPVGVLGLPFLQVFANITGSIGGGQALASLLVVVQLCGSINYMATCSRQIFAFARDKGLPLNWWIAKVDAGGVYPVNAVVIVWGFTVLICLITLGSTIAFDAITSLTMLALFSTYTISCSCLLWRRTFGGGVSRGPWSLGRFGLPINILAVCYCYFVLVWLPWPVEVPVTLTNWNWSSLMYVGVLTISTTYYLLVARKHYAGPVVHTKPNLQ